MKFPEASEKSVVNNTKQLTEYPDTVWMCLLFFCLRLIPKRIDFCLELFQLGDDFIDACQAFFRHSILTIDNMTKIKILLIFVQ